VRNGHYSLQVLDKGEDAAPSLVFDDGRFTYFEFGGAREVPAIFAYGSDDAPTRVNWHMQGNLVVVERTARRFTLRLGDAVAGVFNEAFDPVGLETPNATVSAAVRRILRDKP
jgi:type IV secretion system protein VirB9